jgi:DNA polymerase-3 subunit alpha
LDRRLVFDELRRVTTLSGRELERRYGFSRQAVRRIAERIAVHMVMRLAAGLGMPDTARRSRVAWEEIVSITYAGDVDAFDITVDGIHSFVANNIIVHNCVYQDQVLKISLEMAGMTWGEADRLRKAMGKKLPEEMAQMKQAFFDGFDTKTTKWVYRRNEEGTPVAVAVPKPTYPRAVAEGLWEAIETFSGYGFNAAHAAAYAQLACQTAYLKAKYPVEYMAACLSIETGTPERMAVVLAECRRLGIPILPPDVSHSEMDFAVEGHAVRYALQAVKNVGASAIRSIVEARESGGPFRDLDDFCRRVEWKSLNKRALESLIKAGAMDGLGNRSLLLGNLDRICSHAQRAERAAAAGQASLFDAMSDAEALSLPPLLLTSAPEVPQKKLLAWEKEMLGLYVSQHPLAAFQSESRRLGAVPIRALSPEQAGQRVKVGAQIATMRQIITKKGDTMLVMEIEDLEGTIEAVAFPRTYNRFRELWQEDAILLIDGTVDVRNDRLQLIVEEAAVLERKVSTGAGTLSVYVRRSGDDDRDIARIREAYLLLRQFPGTDRFELLTDEGGRRVPIPLPAGDGSACCCPELLERLQALLGPDAVQVVAPAPQPADPDVEPLPAVPIPDAADADALTASEDTDLMDAG